MDNITKTIKVGIFFQVFFGSINGINYAEAKTGVRVGVDIPMEQLQKEFDVVYIGVGAQAGSTLPVPGGDAPNCISGVRFLESYNQGRLLHASKKVIVIGEKYGKAWSIIRG